MEGMEVTPSFWQGKHVLLTGHTGFKGSWLALWLHRLGASVTGFSLAPPSEPNLFTLANIHQCIADVRGDIRELAALNTTIAQHRPDIIIHMAAQSLVRHSYTHPVETYATNVMGTVNLLEAVRHANGVRAVLIVTSDKCYENSDSIIAPSAKAFSEDDPMGGHDPYSSSKGCAELVIKAYRDAYRSDWIKKGTAIASARAGNVIGGGDWAESRLIHDAMRAAIAGNTLRLRNPNAIRPWQHVLEPLSGYLMLLEKLYCDGQAFAEGWNFGPKASDTISVERVVKQMALLWRDMKWKYDTDTHPHEAASLTLDCSNAQQILGWEPLLTLNEALAWTINWYKGYKNHADLRALCETQIDQYQSLLST